MSIKFDFKTAPNPPSITLGGGYSSDRQMATYIPCLNNGTITYNGGGKSTIFFSDARTFDEIQKDLNVDVSESVSIGLFEEEASASYARHIKDDAYTQSFYYSETVTLPTAIYYPSGYGTSALSDFGKGVYQSGPDMFRDVCGDLLIQQSHLGAGLYVTIRLTFSSLADKSTFNAQFGAKYGSIANVSGKISKIVSENHIKGNIEVSALQVGGDVTQLAKIFTEGPDPYAITRCSFEDLASCQKSINGVLAYAANNFPDQVDYKGGKVLGNAEIIGYTFMPYEKIGLQVGNSILNSTIIEDRKKLGDIYLSNQKQEAFVEHIKNSVILSSFPKIYKARYIMFQVVLKTI